MNIGKLYQIKKYFWFLYPSNLVAAAAQHDAKVFRIRTAPRTAVATSDDATAASYVEAWSKHLNCNVTYISENSIFCLLAEDRKYLKVLTTNGEIGWMIYPENDEWTKGCIEEVNE